MFNAKNNCRKKKPTREKNDRRMVHGSERRQQINRQIARMQIVLSGVLVSSSFFFVASFT